MKNGDYIRFLRSILPKNHPCKSGKLKKAFDCRNPSARPYDGFSERLNDAQKYKIFDRLGGTPPFRNPPARLRLAGAPSAPILPMLRYFFGSKRGSSPPGPRRERAEGGGALKALENCLNCYFQPNFTFSTHF